MRLAVGVLELVGEPIQALVQAVAGGGARRLDVPVAVAQRVQAQLVCYLSCIHCVWQILAKQPHINSCFYDQMAHIIIIS